MGTGEVLVAVIVSFVAGVVAGVPTGEQVYAWRLRRTLRKIGRRAAEPVPPISQRALQQLTEAWGDEHTGPADPRQH